MGPAGRGQPLDQPNTAAGASSEVVFKEETGKFLLG